MLDFEHPPGHVFPRFLLCLALAATAVAGLLAGGSALGVIPLQASAAAKVGPDWSFARPALDNLNAAAIQVCAAEALARESVGTTNEEIRKAQVEVLANEYTAAAKEYNQQVRARIEAGIDRPTDVPSRALPLDLARQQLCLKTAKSPPLASPAPALPSNAGRFLTLEQLDAYAAAAGWPNEPGWWPEMRKIILCETRSLDTMAHNTSDPHGGSYGLAQLNGRYHFDRAGEDFERRFDPVVNLRTALWLRTARGHFGGYGGWYNCAKLWGID
jgi:hypothetical protein